MITIEFAIACMNGGNMTGRGNRQSRPFVIYIFDVKSLTWKVTGARYQHRDNAIDSAREYGRTPAQVRVKGYVVFENASSKKLFPLKG